MGQRAGIEPTLSSSGGVVEREKGGRPPSPKSAWVCETFHQFIVAPSTMKYQKLGSSDMEVSRVCLGTMTFGRQNTEAEAHEQLDYAIKTRGVNFLDTAELYPVPTNRETQGLTEKYEPHPFRSRSGRSVHGSELRQEGGGPVGRREHPERGGRLPREAPDVLHRRVPAALARPLRPVLRQHRLQLQQVQAGQRPL